MYKDFISGILSGILMILALVVTNLLLLATWSPPLPNDMVVLLLVNMFYLTLMGSILWLLGE